MYYRGREVVDHSSISVASFPGPHTVFGCTEERKGPGMFPHVRDIEGREVVERT